MKANTISKQYIGTMSEFAKDKKKWWEKYKNIANRWYVNRDAIWEYICLDEKHVKNQFYTWVSNKNWKRLVSWIKWIGADKIIFKLKRWLWKPARDYVKEVAVDMSNWMEKIAREVFKMAIIITDRFHVRKLVNELMGAVKNRTKLKISKDFEEAKKKASKNKKKFEPKRYWTVGYSETKLELISRAHYQIRENKKDWNRNQKRRWRIMKKIGCFKWLIAIYELNVELYEIYENKLHNKETATIEIVSWIKKARKYRRVPELLHIANSVENRLDTITNYFISRHSNWYAEGFHSRLSRLVSNNRWFVDEDYMVYRFIKAFW